MKFIIKMASVFAFALPLILTGCAGAEPSDLQDVSADPSGAVTESSNTSADTAETVSDFTEEQNKRTPGQPGQELMIGGELYTRVYAWGSMLLSECGDGFEVVQINSTDGTERVEAALKQDNYLGDTIPVSDEPQEDFEISGVASSASVYKADNDLLILTAELEDYTPEHFDTDIADIIRERGDSKIYYGGYFCRSESFDDFNSLYPDLAEY